MTYEQAAKEAARRAYSDEPETQAWVNEHIAEAAKGKRPCSCSLCYWRRVHINKLMEGHHAQRLHST